MKKIQLSKMSKIFLLLGSLMIAATTTAVVTILFINNDKKVEIKYLFADKEFDNKKQVFEYAYSQAENTNYNFKDTKFLIDDKVFNSRSELNDFIQKNYPIESLSTIKNPSDSRYLVSNSGELNQLVLTEKDEKGINVYKGINGDAFLDRDGALNTYLNSYEQKYSVDGIYFDSFYNAQKYYTETIQTKLEDPKNEPVKKVYTHGGIEYKEGTENEIKSWIKSTLKRGFEYEGKPFSDYNYSEFKAAMQNLDEKIIDENIVPVTDADKSSYWISHYTTNPGGYFIGPRYVESNEKVAKRTDFQVVDTQDVNAILSIMFGTLPFITTSEAIENLTEGLSSTYDFENYLEQTFAEYNLNQEILNNFLKNYLSKFGKAIMADVSTSLNGLDKECTNFDKTLIIFKRLLTAAKVYDVKGASGSDYEGFEQNVKELIVQLMSLESKYMAKMITPNEKPDSEEWKIFLLNKEISFDDIYSLFLNPQKFYDDGGNQRILGEKIKEIFLTNQKNIGEIIDIVSKGAAIADGIDDLKEASVKSTKSYEEGAKKVFSAVNTRLNEEGPEKIAEKLGLELKESSTQVLPFVAAVGIAAAVWAIGEMASFTSFVTLEAKIDSKTSIYYFEPTFKIPFTKILPNVTDVNTNIRPITKAPLKMMLPPDSDGKDVPVYEFNHQYFLDKEIAKEKLVDAIYLNPEHYLPCKSLLTSGYGEDDSYTIDLPPICKDDCSIEHEHVTASYQDNVIAETKDKFVEKLFNKYYESEAKYYYNDGFHEFFDDRTAALNSLQRKVQDVNNYDEAYSYTINGQTFYKDTKTEITQFIKDNQLIESKRVINTDLIEGMFFDTIPDFYDKEYKIYKIMLNGANQYFRTKLEAERYLENQLNIETLNYYELIKTYQYNNVSFMSEDEFENWIESRIKEVK